jgi:hypothetical protein
MDVWSKLTGRQKGRLLAFVVAGILGSWLSSFMASRQGETAWATRAETEAKRLTATFALLYDNARAPLQSLATLFNGSGRVAAEEFTQTINDLKSRSGPSFPSAMVFITSSTPASCDAVAGCWLVSYSTAEDGLLKPGADMSRFAPTAQTIASALADQNVVKLGPVYREADGTQRSFLAVTIKNTRQFGVIASVVDYDVLAKAMADRYMPPGVRLRIEGSFSTGAAMTPATPVAGEATPAAGTKLTFIQDLNVDRAQLKLSWDFTGSYIGGARTTAALPVAGLLGTLAAALLMALVMARRNAT